MKFGDNKLDGLRFSYALSLATQLGFLVLSSVGGFILLGYWLDRKLATSPLFVIAGVILGTIITIYEAYRMMSPLIEAPKEQDNV